MLVLALQFVAGLVVLYFGADFFIKGAARLARSFGVSQFVIGMTVVGFGTSAPELAVNLSAAFSGSYEMALGNVVGSNLANVGLILGIAAMIRPLAVQMRLLAKELPVMILTALLLWGLAWNGEVSRLDGALFLCGFVALTVYIFKSARHEDPTVKEELAEFAEQLEDGGETGNHPSVEPEKINLTVSLLQAIGGLAGLIGGAELMVRAAVEIARSYGLSELLIGLTIVSVGTSLPELASSAIAAWKGDTDIAVGNVIGSNIFNILLILGATALIHPLPVAPSLLRVEIPLMLAFMILLLVFMRRRMRITRGEGIVLFLAYAGFIVWLATQTN